MSEWSRWRHQIMEVAIARNSEECGANADALAADIAGRIEEARQGAQAAPQASEATVDHIEAAESWLAVCQGEASQWPTVQAISTEAGAHALTDIAESLRGLREDLQALTEAVREAAETGVRVVTD